MQVRDVQIKNDQGERVLLAAGVTAHQLQGSKTVARDYETDFRSNPRDCVIDQLHVFRVIFNQENRPWHW